MSGHTLEDYGKLLMEYLNKAGVHVVLWLDAFKTGCQWQGSMTLPRQKLENCFGGKAEMNGDAHISLNNMGEIRLYYSEPIVFDLEKKARREAREAACRAEKEEGLNDLTPMAEAAFDEDFDFDCDCELDFEENEAEGENRAAAETLESVAGEEKALSAEEDDEHISERKRLQVLETLYAASTRLYIHGRDNETRIHCSAYREMDSCSRNSAKKAAQWIYDELLGACSEIGWLANELKFHRMPAEDKEREWYEEPLTDTFEHVETVCGILDKERAIEASVRKQKEIEELIDGCEEEQENGGELTSLSKFRKMANAAFQAELQMERKRQEELGEELDELKKKLAGKR